MDKKGSLWPWFFSMVMILFIATAYFAFTKPFQYIDDQYGHDKINFTKDPSMTNKAEQVINKVRLYWLTWPVLIIVFLIIWAFFSSLKQDPNYPYQ